MKPAAFAYVRPDTLEEALNVLAEHAEDARALAGGQSLVPAMNFRLAQPAMLVDLNRIETMAGIDASNGCLRIGAMTRQREMESDERVRALAPLVSETMPFVAHPPIRTRGTLGGSLAHADPAAELPAVMLALDATIGIRHRDGARTVRAADFFTGLYSTVLEPGELIVDVSIPERPTSTGWAFDEVARRHGDYALAGAAAVVSLDDSGKVSAARVALLGVHDRPVLAIGAARMMAGATDIEQAIAAAADAGATGDVDPTTDIHASSAYRRHLTGVLIRRVLARAVERASRRT